MRAVASLVTGVGYIGARLALDLLDQGDEVVGLENWFSTHPHHLASLLAHPRFRLVRGSIADPAAVRAALDLARPRVVYHLAAQPSAHPQAASAQYTERSNLVGPRVLLEALQGRDIQALVLAGSFKVLGDELPAVVDESQPYGRIGDLAHLSKIYLEKLAEMHAYRGGPRTVSVRLGITYGLGPVMKRDSHFQTVPNLFCARVAAGEPLRVLASRAAGFIHLRDAAGALRSAAVLPAERPYQVANAAAEVYGIGEVASMVQQAAHERGLNARIEGSTELSGARFTVRSCLESSGLFAPRESMREALTELLDYFKGGTTQTASRR